MSRLFWERARELLRRHWWLFVTGASIVVLLTPYMVGWLSNRQESSNSSRFAPTSAPTAPPSPTPPPAQTVAGGQPVASPSPALALPAASPTPASSAPALVGSAAPVSPTPIPGLPPFPQAELAEILAGAGSFGAVVYDERLGARLFEQNARATFYAASLIKLPVAIALYRQADRGLLRLDEQIATTAADMVPGTGRIQGEPVGTAYTLRELCRRMIADSDNVAANLLLTRLGFDEVNRLMAELGATSTTVQRRFFDDAAREAGRDIRTSAGDMELLLRLLLADGALLPASRAAILAAMAETTDDTKIAALLPPGVTVRNKTGAIPGVEHDAAIVELPSGRRYILVLMGDSLSGNGAGVSAIAEASRIVYEYEAALP